MAWVERLAPTSTAAFELGGAIMLLVHDHWIVASLLLVLLSVPPIIRATAEQTRALGQKAYLEFCGKAR
ncbi:MAG: hypothetical protein KGL44_05725, partial [Sphingomonadales bacterium]|nr:hypothetical protein [Sphingomonadales bacterium]